MIPIGYADGISRAWETELDLLASKIKGKNSRSICMDMLMVDVTEIDCTEGDRNYFLKTKFFYR
jgi:alanine racemase